MSQIYDNLEEGSEEYKKLFSETKERFPTLTEEDFSRYVKSKKYFSSFKVLDDVPMNTEIDLSKTDLKMYTEAENQDNVEKAMQRLYGEPEA